MRDALLTNKDASALIAAEEAVFLRELLAGMPAAGDIVEIGTHSGDGSTPIFLEHAAKTNARLFALDLFLSQDFKRKVEAMIAGTNAEMVQGYSAEIGRTWAKEVAFVFVDGDHGYPRTLPNGHESGVAYDILAWHPWLRVGGIMVLHDYTGDANTFGQSSFLPIEHAADGLLNEPRYRFLGKVGTLAAYEKLSQGFLYPSHRPKAAAAAYRETWNVLDAKSRAPSRVIVFGEGPAVARVRECLARSFRSVEVLLADFSIPSGGVEIDGLAGIPAESLKRRAEFIIAAGNVDEERNALEYFDTQRLVRGERYATYMDFLGWHHLGRYGYW